MASPISGGVSRRKLLKTGATAVVGVGSYGLGQGHLQAQSSAAIGTGAVAGRKYRAWVRHPDNRVELEDLTLRPLAPRGVVVRAEAYQLCYTDTTLILGPERALTPERAVPDPKRAPFIIGAHGGVGVVEAIGPQVRRVRVGDRVIVALTIQCGECFNCMRGRADRCMGYGDTPTPVATLSNGTGVMEPNGGIGDLMVVNDERLVPIFTKLPAAELSMLSCVSACGLGTTMVYSPVTPGSDVVVLGAGPVGLSAIQGARIKGAAHIIAVDPIPERRTLALKLGATTALDPNAEGTNLVPKIRDLCKLSTDRTTAGGGRIGPDFVVEAVGGDQYPAKIPGPDPTGVLPLQQAWELCSRIGTFVTCGVGRPAKATVTFPANGWANGAKIHYAGNWSATNAKRDIPVFVRLMETKQLDLGSLVTAKHRMEQMKQGFEAVAARTTVGAVVEFS